MSNVQSKVALVVGVLFVVVFWSAVEGALSAEAGYTATGPAGSTEPAGGPVMAEQMMSYMDTNRDGKSAMYEAPQTGRAKINFNGQWRFHQGEVFNGVPEFVTCDDREWEQVDIPHSPRLDPARPDPMRPTWGSLQWEGVCWYRKHFRVDDKWRGKKLFLEFEAANARAYVWLNNVQLKVHYGGYLPFVVDITEHVRFGKTQNVLTVKVDNTYTPSIPIGLKDWFNPGGLYRNVWLHATDLLHVSNAVYANEIAGGGVFVSYPSVNVDEAQVRVRTHVVNEYAEKKTCELKTTIITPDGRPVADAISSRDLEAGDDAVFVQRLTVRNPERWHPYHPYLYDLHTEVRCGGVPVDTLHTSIGIRRIDFSHDNGFTINGDRLVFRGVNYLQTFPYVGSAMGDSSFVRDAMLIREGGFNFVRCAQYPLAPVFLDACDRLGILVMNAIPGVHEHGTFLDPDFQTLSFQNMRDMIRRDRNHPSVILWELGLAETQFDMAFAERAVAIGHEEYPGDQCFVAGWLSSFGWSKYPWTRDVYDVYFRNADHEPSGWDYDGDAPFLIDSYGSWRYGRMDSTSDINRMEGEAAMLVQAHNHQESHNRNLSLPFLSGDALFTSIDYGEWPSGVLDEVRIPKFSYYFFQSQRNPEVTLPHVDSGPMVYIANYWTEQSPRDVTVFSNCDEVRLFLNDDPVGIQGPDKGNDTSHIAHPPFTFAAVPWRPGVLRADAYRNGTLQATHTVRTPGVPAALGLKLDARGCVFEPNRTGMNVVYAYAAIVDAEGTVVPQSTEAITFSVSGPGRFASPERVTAEVGVACAILYVETDGTAVTVRASGGGFEDAQTLNISQR